MSDPGPAQLELIRRYARTLREMHADAMRMRAPQADRAGRITKTRPASQPIRQVTKAMTGRSAAAAQDVAGRVGGPPTLRAS
ncbi:MAG TPA: hypothetical protein VNT03_20910 [Baekduia sp.]|nr:hypothetical protein [Baekduia sp.]